MYFLIIKEHFFHLFFSLFLLRESGDTKTRSSVLAKLDQYLTLTIQKSESSFQKPLKMRDIILIRDLLNAYIAALQLCTQLSVEMMKRKGIDDGHIIMISSMSGHRVPPNPSTR